MAVLEDLNKMMEVQEAYNTEDNVMQRDQDIVEVQRQNCLEHRNKDVVSLTVTKKLLVANAKVDHLVGVALSTDKNEMVQYMFQW